jgi:large subunit ribosomal protein L10
MRSEKQLLLDDLKNRINKSEAMIVTKYDRFGPTASWNFSKKLHEFGGDFEVVKKRIFAKAMKECGMEINVNELEGHIGVVFVEKDAIGAAKATYDFSKENENLFKILSGKFEGKLCSSGDMEYISTLPSENEMKSQMLALFESPMSQLLSVIESSMTGVMFCLENKSKQ